MQLIQYVLSEYGYAALFVLMFTGAAYLPLPTSLVMVGAGVLSARGYMDARIALAVIVTANVLGDLAGYGLARRRTPRSKWARRTEKHVSLARLERYLKERGIFTVAVSRAVPFVNGGVNRLAGMCRLSLVRFAGAGLLGNLVVAAGYLVLGLAFGRAWGDAERAATVGAVIALLLGGFAVAGVLLIRREEPGS